MGERLRRCQQVRVRVAGQRLAWRLERRLVHAVDRRDLRAVENRYALEQDPALILAVTGLGLARLDRHRYWRSGGKPPCRMGGCRG